jgi:hypothetical protein
VKGDHSLHSLLEPEAGPTMPVMHGPPQLKKPEMEFLNGISAFLVEGYGHKLVSSQTRVFVLFSNLIFRSTKMLFVNTLDFSFFADFLICFLNTRRRWFSLTSASV